jgi:transcriptional regulator with XRE-family HTH domain
MIGKVIRELREKRGMTLTELAKITGLSKSKISDIERYGRMPRFDDLCAICYALNFDFKKIWLQIKPCKKEKAETPSK